MQLKIIRYSSGIDDTLGIMFIDDNFFCYTMEDEYRAVKVRGETRISGGKYKVEFREVVSPKTEKYRNKYSWFTYHLELQNVPNFKNVYIHVGNTEKDTEGCILVGDSSYSNTDGYGDIGKSRVCFERLYKIVSAELKMNKEVFITIQNI